MKLSEMRQILDSGEIQLTKSLGQNFLHDQNQVRRIISAADLTRDDKVLEIGPGLGPLTELLAAEAGEVLAIEKDKRLFDFLQRRFAADEKLKLMHADALDLLCSQPKDWSAWKLVSNLPYSVASPMLVELAESPGIPSRIVVTLQLEVAQRIMARTADENYGILSLLLQLRYEPRDFFKIPASCFFPEPDVDSACITLVHRPEPLLSQDGARIFTKLVKRAFSQRRKMMLKLLKQDWPAERLQAAYAGANLSSDVRAERVSLEQFVHLTRALS